jgi:hypothetical protein
MHLARGFGKRWALLALLLSGAQPGKAQTPAGPEFQINSYTTGYQINAAVSESPGAGFVVTWASYGSPGSDSDYSIQGQRYGSAGAPVGGQFQVNTFTSGNQFYSSVAVDASGAFVVVWDSNGSPGGDASGYSIQGQRYSSAGAPQGGQFQVNAYTTGSQRMPSLATAPDGSFVVVWASGGSPGADTSSYSIQGRRYDSAGAPQGGQFEINSYTTGSQLAPAAVPSPGGGFLVVWSSQGSPGTDASGSSIQARGFAPDGSALAAQFQVNSYATGSQIEPAAAMDADGDFIVSWASAGSPGNDGFGSSVQARRFSAAGSPAGPDFQVNSYTANDQTSPAVTARSSGDFMVVWESRGSAGTDNSSWSVQGQRFAAGGETQGPQFQVNTYIAYGQVDASAVVTSPSEFVVVWHGYGSAGNDTGISSSIHGQRFSLPPAVPALSPGLAAACAALLLAFAVGSLLRDRASRAPARSRARRSRTAARPRPGSSSRAR